VSRLDRIPHDRAADAAAFAVGALEAQEAEEYRHHLTRCSQCRDELAAFRRVADVLPGAVPQYPPPPGLRRRVVRAVQTEPRPLNPVLPRPRTRPRRLPRVHGSRPALAAVGIVVILVAVIAAVGLQPGRAGGSRVLAASVMSSAGTAQLRIADGHADLIVQHLRAPAAGRVYEVWLKRSTAAPAPSKALFSVTADGAADVGVPGDLNGVSEIVVTQEPAGGSRVPTGPPVIVAPTS